MARGTGYGTEVYGVRGTWCKVYGYRGYGVRGTRYGVRGSGGTGGYEAR